MDKIIVMLILGMAPQRDGTLKEVWRIEKQVTLSHCLEMNRLSSAGRYGAIIVKCDPPKEEK
jgi:hypothetical protein